MSKPEETAEAALRRDDAIKGVLVSLIAAVSLLKAGGKKAAPSDRMFDMMIADYERAIARGRKEIYGVVTDE